ncbi:MAG: aminoglycoside phosphotransferase family protein [Verrucomicrobiales bacterium]
MASRPLSAGLPTDGSANFRLPSSVSTHGSTSSVSGLPDLERLETLTRQHVATWKGATLEFEPILKGGSGRAFHRVRCTSPGTDRVTVIAMAYTMEREENGRFEAISDFLKSHRVAVPDLVARDTADRLLWIEDLGPTDLWSLRNEDWDTVRAPLYRAALAEVAKIHSIREDQLPPELPQLQPGFDRSLYQWEQEYFFEHFAGRFARSDVDTLLLIQQCAALRELIDELATLPRFLVHRDFQSQNILIHEGRPWLIDYQGMRLGRPEYDLASLLYDPYVPLSAPQREELALYYHAELTPAIEPWTDFSRRLDRCAVQRLMQALGAYGFLGVVRGQPAFLEHIPCALSRLREAAVERGALPELASLLPNS